MLGCSNISSISTLNIFSLSFFSYLVRIELRYQMDAERFDSPSHIRRNLQRLNITFNEEAVINLSSRHIPFYVQFIASLGRTFNHRTSLDFTAAVGSFIAMNELLHGCDHFIDQFQMRHEFSSLKSSVLDQSLKPDRPTEAQSYIARLADMTISFLHKPVNRNVIVVQPDKGGKSVIMDREDYDEKANQHIENNISLGNYVTVTNMSIEDVQRRVECQYRVLASEISPFLILDKVIKEPLKGESYLLPKFYGAPKVHKPGIPLRPIIASCDMIGIFLSSWLL